MDFDVASEVNEDVHDCIAPQNCSDFQIRIYRTKCRPSVWTCIYLK